MPNLKKVQLYRSTSLNDISCLKNAQDLTDLNAISIPAPIKNFNLPKLTTLFLRS
jgi:hypothetical protein